MSVLTTFASSASAQDNVGYEFGDEPFYTPPKKVSASASASAEESYGYEFGDDPLTAGGFGP